MQDLGITPRQWPTLFLPWGGAFPTTDEQILQLKSTIKQNAHMVENHPVNPWTWGFKQAGMYLGEPEENGANDTYFGTDEPQQVETVAVSHAHGLPLHAHGLPSGLQQSVRSHHEPSWEN